MTVIKGNKLAKNPGKLIVGNKQQQSLKLMDKIQKTSSHLFAKVGQTPKLREYKIGRRIKLYK